MEKRIVISIGVAVSIWAAKAASRGGRLEWMRLKNPVADVDDVDILLDDDVAR